MYPQFCLDMYKQPIANEKQMYDLASDPEEKNNLYGKAEYAAWRGI